jgi:hypothetical protein
MIESDPFRSPAPPSLREPRTVESTDGRIVVVTYRTDDEVIDVLRTSGMAFPLSLVQEFAIRGGWTVNQRAWAHKLANEIASQPNQSSQPNHPSQSPAEPSSSPSMLPIVRMFHNAAARVKHPRITFDFEDQPIVLHRAGIRSRTPGHIQVTDGRGFCDGKYYGRIDLDGIFHPSAVCTPDVEKFLAAFASDPSDVAATYGRQQGNCVFCNTRLTNELSVAVGYGTTCARTYGLRYPTKSQLEAVKAADDANSTASISTTSQGE